MPVRDAAAPRWTSPRSLRSMGAPTRLAPMSTARARRSSSVAPPGSRATTATRRASTRPRSTTSPTGPRRSSPPSAATSLAGARRAALVTRRSSWRSGARARTSPFPRTSRGATWPPSRPTAASRRGTCGSCWAHASRLAMESRAEIKGLKNIGFSANQLIACTPNPKHCGGEGGCDGATAELAYEYVFNKGLLQASEWRAKAGDNQTAECPEALKASTEVATRGIIGADGSETHRGAAKMAGRAVGLTGWTKLPENKEDAIVRELMTNGPLYVAVAAGDHWFDYKEGVMAEDSCDRDFIVNHAVVLFAWGVKQKTVRGPVKYWQIKNSWGPQWGEQGTGRFIRSDHEEKECGWDEDPQSGSGCDGGPERVWVCGSCGILYDAVAPHF
ncbi:unnamed protein product [Prorocentrum cordatum]|uniref:Peptidase C1A papain C-terminal domain-containing protein n=1 Tax=Prorocentrum cordatum TaxID=2364126 RepID=A0ABN9V4N4_9DINO|nr:unnamed protein product [Polarella glacialis]